MCAFSTYSTFVKSNQRWLLKQPKLNLKGNFWKFVSIQTSGAGANNIYSDIYRLHFTIIHPQACLHTHTLTQTHTPAHTPPAEVKMERVLPG